MSQQLQQIHHVGASVTVEVARAAGAVERRHGIVLPEQRQQVRHADDPVGAAVAGLAAATLAAASRLPGPVLVVGTALAAAILAITMQCYYRYSRLSFHSPKFAKEAVALGEVFTLATPKV